MGKFNHLGGRGIRSHAESYKSVVERAILRELADMGELVDGCASVDYVHVSNTQLKNRRRIHTGVRISANHNRSNTIAPPDPGLTVNNAAEGRVRMRARPGHMCEIEGGRHA
jgi:hypothetical protein